MDTSFIVACCIAGLAAVLFLVCLIGMFWESLQYWRDVLAWRAWQKRHPRSFIQYPDKPVYWCKYNKNRKTAK